LRSGRSEKVLNHRFCVGLLDVAGATRDSGSRELNGDGSSELRGRRAPPNSVSVGSLATPKTCSSTGLSCVRYGRSVAGCFVAGSYEPLELLGPSSELAFGVVDRPPDLSQLNNLKILSAELPSV
jgi:hypothetical protein